MKVMIHLMLWREISRVVRPWGGWMLSRRSSRIEWNVVGTLKRKMFVN